MGPFTLNALRTLFAIPLLVVLFGPQTSFGAIRSLRRDRDVWVVGVLWLGLTFVPYLWSLRYLPPTIATLTVYLAPLVVAGWQRFRFHEAVSPLAVPMIVVTIAGGYLATQGPGGIAYGRDGWTGLGLAFIGMLGWSAYTIHLKVLTRTRDANVLTLAAFAASAITFVIGALLLEGFRVDWDNDTRLYLALYVLFPTALSFWLYTLSLKGASATTVAVLLGVELLSTAIVSYFVTREAFGGIKVLGLGIVAAAVTVYLWDERRRLRRASAGVSA